MKLGTRDVPEQHGLTEVGTSDSLALDVHSLLYSATGAGRVQGTTYLGHFAWLPMCSFRFLLKHRIVSN